MVAVIIVGLLAAIAIPSYKRIAYNAKAANVTNNFRTFKSSFLTFELENGFWPDDYAPGELPVELADYINAHQFEANTEIGGNWDWDYGTKGITAGISITGSGSDDELLTEIDGALDDGNLAEGNMRKLGEGGLTYILDE